MPNETKEYLEKELRAYKNRLDSLERIVKLLESANPEALKLIAEEVRAAKKDQNQNRHWQSLGLFLLGCLTTIFLLTILALTYGTA